MFYVLGASSPFNIQECPSMIGMFFADPVDYSYSYKSIVSNESEDNLTTEVVPFIDNFIKTEDTESTVVPTHSFTQAIALGKEANEDVCTLGYSSEEDLPSALPKSFRPANETPRYAKSDTSIASFSSFEECYMPSASSSVSNAECSNPPVIEPIYAKSVTSIASFSSSEECYMPSASSSVSNAECSNPPVIEPIYAKSVTSIAGFSSSEECYIPSASSSVSNAECSNPPVIDPIYAKSVTSIASFSSFEECYMSSASSSVSKAECSTLPVEETEYKIDIPKSYLTLQVSLKLFESGEFHPDTTEDLLRSQIAQINRYLKNFIQNLDMSCDREGEEMSLNVLNSPREGRGDSLFVT